MKRYEKQTIERDTLVEVACDLCGTINGSEAWRERTYHENDVTIKHEMSHGYGSDGGSGRRLELDICPSCFTEKVLPALRALGLKREYVDFDW